MDEETGDFLLCGWTVIDLETLAAITAPRSRSTSR
jgi:hypothetical protein